MSVHKKWVELFDLLAKKNVDSEVQQACVDLRVAVAKSTAELIQSLDSRIARRLEVQYNTLSGTYFRQTQNGDVHYCPKCYESAGGVLSRLDFSHGRARCQPCGNWVDPSQR